ncbi:MAG: SgcJ/EcaC family oxidoreductase [Blastocatellia bacterium]
MPRYRSLLTLPLLSLLFIWLPASLRQSPAPPPPEREEAAVRQLVDDYVAAREKIDPIATADLFTPDADQLVSSGEWRLGREAVVAGTVASSRQNSGSRTITITQIRFLSPDIALVDGRYTLTPRDGAAPRQMWTSLLVQKTEARWRIAAIRNMLPASP